MHDEFSESRRSMLKLSTLTALGYMTKYPAQMLDVLSEREDAKIEKRLVPSSGEMIPVIGLGTWQSFDVSESATERNALKAVLAALLAKGASVIDSSPMYGYSEEVTGDLATALKIRQQLFLATKVWTTGRDAGIAQMNNSFVKLKTSVVDLMQIHNLVDTASHIKTLRQWKEKGKIRYWGLTHYVTSAYPELMRLIKTEQPDFVQFNYNIAVRDAEHLLLTLAQEKGIAVIINRPFEEGALFTVTRGKSLPTWCSEYDINSWAQFFLKFIISHPGVTCTIPGTSKEKHALDNLGAGFGKIPDEKTRLKMIAHFKTL